MEILLQKEKKKHQISVFHFQKYAWIFIWCLFPQLHSWCSQHSHWSQWASAPLRKGRVRGIQHCTLSLDRVPWMLCLQPDLLPSWFLKTRPSRVSPGYPAPHHHPSQLTLPSFLLQPNMVCDRTITVPPELCLPPWLQSLFKKKKKVKKPKEHPVADWDGDESCHSSEHCCRPGTESPRLVSAKTGVSWWIITLADRTEISKKTQWQLLHRTILSGLLNTVIHCVNKDRQLHYAIVCY